MSLLAAAQGGNEHAFEELVAGHRRELHVHCYRMLGNLADADEALATTLDAAWRGIGGFEGRSPLRAWLCLIATHSCLRTARLRPPRVLPWHVARARDPEAALGGPVTQPIYLDPWPGADDEVATREDLDLAFLAALQQLPPDQRAVLLLHDVLRFGAAEVAAMLDTTTASVTSTTQRARAAVEARVPARDDTPVSDDEEHRVVLALADAWERGDVRAIVARLTADVRLTMPPLRAWFDGRADVARFLEHHVTAASWQVRTTVANQRPALARYRQVDRTHRLVAVDVLHVSGDGVGWVASFLDPATLARFGLPATL